MGSARDLAEKPDADRRRAGRGAQAGHDRTRHKHQQADKDHRKTQQRQTRRYCHSPEHRHTASAGKAPPSHLPSGPQSMTVDKAFAPQTWRLLVLDDERDVGQTIVTMARSAGVEAKAVTEAEDFFSQLDAYRPTHVAIDLMMPSLDGIGVIRQLADTHADVSVIIISGASARVLEAAKRSATEHGLSVAGILTKPCSRQALVATLEMQAASIAPESHPRDRQSGGALEARLVAALAEDRIGIALQPKVALESGELIGFEALARWQNDGIAVSPDQFVVVAEKAGMIDALTRTVLGKAVRWLARQEHSGSLTVAVNVSARSLKGDALLQMIDATCRDHHLSPERLIVELTESEAVGDQTDALDTITQLRLRRIALAIEDF